MSRLAAWYVLALLVSLVSPAAAQRCQSGAFAVADAGDLAAVKGLVARACPCASFDGASAATGHGAFVRCARGVIKDAADGTPVLGFGLRRECQSTLRRFFRRAACGYPAAENRQPCCQHDNRTGRNRALVRPAASCQDSAGGRYLRNVCPATPFADAACSNDAVNSCAQKVVQTTVDIPSGAAPAHTPGSPGVPPVVDPRFVAQFGSATFSLNNARYTRYRLAGPEIQPDAILILVPGFEGGAGDMKILAENLIPKAQAGGQVVEVWGFDRRTNQLEDLAGLDVAEEFLSAEVALDWLYGAELTLPLHPALAAGPNRRANFYNANADTAFMASWTNLVFSQDIDAVVEAARSAAVNQNVFLGGHSAGTGFTARYAATDFNLTGVGPAEPGYAKLRGLVLLEGGGGSTGGTPLTNDSLDRIIAKFDGGLYGAVRDNAGRCVDGLTACTIDTEAADCSGQVPPKCTPATGAYAVVPGLLNPRILSAGEVSAIQAATDPDTGENIVSADQGAAGNNAVAKVPDLGTLAVLGETTAIAGIGGFVDDDGLVAGIASFVSTSAGGPGPVVSGLKTWQSITEGPLPGALTPDNGPPPVALATNNIWGQEVEPTRIERLATTFYAGGTNFTDNYYPNAGPGTTTAPGRCVGTCQAGNLGAPCSADNQCQQSINLDSSALSIGRGRRDIENLTQAASIDIPVIGFGGSNGLTPVPGRFTAFAQSIGPCTAPSCSGAPRVVDPNVPNPAFPTFGDVAGGFEVHISEGYAHVDVLTAEDDATNHVLGPLVDFLARNAQ